MDSKKTYKGIIYKYTFPNGKVYIGQTINPVSRKSQHLCESTGFRNVAFWRAYKKYGSFVYEVIESVEADSKETLCERLNHLEQAYISEYNSTNPRYGYNLTSGGKVCVVNEEGRKHMSEARTDKLAVLQYNLDGDFVKEYESTIEAARAVGSHAGSIWSCCLGKASGKRKKKAQIVRGYTFRFKADYPDVPSHIDLSITTLKKKVLQFSLNGSFIKEWDSIIEAADTLGCHESGIRQCCYGTYRQCAGYMWRSRDEYDEIPIKIPSIRAKAKRHYSKMSPERVERHRKAMREYMARPVIQFGLDGEYIAEYPALIDAANNVNGDGASICNACICKTQKSAFGYQWRYKEDVVNPFEGIKPYRMAFGPQRKHVMQYTKEGAFVKEWTSAKEVADNFRVNRNTLYQALTGRRQLLRGFVWKYKTN